MKKLLNVMTVIIFMTIAFTIGVGFTLRTAEKRIDQLTEQIVLEQAKTQQATQLAEDYEFLNRRIDAIPAQYAISCFECDENVHYRFVKSGRTSAGNRYTVTYETMTAHDATELARAIRYFEEGLKPGERMQVDVLDLKGNPM